VLAYTAEGRRVAQVQVRADNDGESSAKWALEADGPFTTLVFWPAQDARSRDFEFAVCVSGYERVYSIDESQLRMIEGNGDSDPATNLPSWGEVKGEYR
jgi:hypothetical protein